MFKFGVVMVLFILVASAVPVSRAQTCLPARLTIGGEGIVTPGSSNRIRANPTTSADAVGLIPAGETFSLLEGPTCAEGYLWWRVSFEGVEGWTVEATEDAYLLNPLIFEGEAISPENATQLTLLETYDCPDNGRLAVNFGMDATGTQLAFNCVFSEPDGRTTVSVVNLVDGVVMGMRMDDLLEQSFAILYFSADGRELMGIPFSDPPLFYRWDAATGELLERAELPMTGSVMAAALASNGELGMSIGGHMISALERTPAFLAIFDPETRTIRQQNVVSNDQYVIALDFNADDSILGLVWEGSRYGFWNLATNTIVTAEQGEVVGLRGRSIRYMPAAQITAAVTGCVETDPEGGCISWELAWVNSEANQVTQTWFLGEAGGNDLAFNITGSLLAVAGWSEVGLWDVENDHLVYTLEALEAGGVLFSADERRLIIGSGQQVQVYGVLLT